MDNKTLVTRIVLRNDSLANWEANSSVVLLKGEAGVAFDTNGIPKLKIGDGMKTWSELSWYGDDNSKPDYVTSEAIEALQAEIAELSNRFGKPADETGTGATGIYKELADIISGTEAKIETAISEKLGEITDNGKIDTVMELVQYVEQHGEEVAGFIGDISALKELVGTTSVQDQIVALLSEHSVSAKKESDALYEHVKYDISSIPHGTIVDYGEKEIRVMCPADTEWTKQSVGSGGNPNMYYMAFKAYAPAGAVSFKEGDSGTIVDRMYTFDDDFAGTDEFGRNYSICWLALASYDEANDVWTYFGKTSNVRKYIGWDYVVEWYDTSGMMIGTDSIRINLSNEGCHNNPEPYYMANVVKEIAVNGALVDVIDNRVDISVHNIIQTGDEIEVAEDGTLRIVKIDATKLVTDSTTLVLDGGTAAV